MAAHFEKRHRPPPALLNGNDLIETFALSPSPLIGETLRKVEEARLAGIVDTRRDALEWAGEYLSGRRKAGP
jgi:hypothetical protein